MARKARKPPVIANPKVSEKLEAAAAAAGLSVQQLADLVFEAGVTPPKVPDGVIERYNLQDLGIKLWGEMQGVRSDVRSAWFAGLVPIQKASVIVVLRDKGFRTEVIARQFGIPVEDVMRTWNAYGSQLGSQVLGIRLDTIAGQLQMAGERAQQMAIEAGDHASYWRIEREKVEVLQSIGVVERAIHRTEVTHKLGDEQKAEIEAIVALRAKQEKRKIEVIELVRIEEKGDELPADVQTDPDEDEDDDE